VSIPVSIGMDISLLGEARLGFVAVILKHPLLQPLRRPGTGRVDPFHPRPRRRVGYGGEDDNAHDLVRARLRVQELLPPW